MVPKSIDPQQIRRRMEFPYPVSRSWLVKLLFELNKDTYRK